MKTSPYRNAGGRWRVRVRDSYVRDIARPLIEQNAGGAIKLDLVLRGLASLESSAVGVVPASISWEELHDLCRDRSRFMDGDKKVKRAWVRDKLARLEGLGLVCRVTSYGRRSEITVLSDAVTTEPLDDPGSKGSQYVTFLGGLTEFGHLGMFSAPELAAYFAAMHAERHARANEELVEVLALRDAPTGGGRWFQPLHWFGDGVGRPERPETHVRYGFSERTLQRGIASLEKRGLMLKERITADPRSGKPFRLGPRILYHNGFNELLHTSNYRRKLLTDRANRARRVREKAAYDNLVGRG